MTFIFSTIMYLTVSIYNFPKRYSKPQREFYTSFWGNVMDEIGIRIL